MFVGGISHLTYFLCAFSFLSGFLYFFCSREILIFEKENEDFFGLQEKWALPFLGYMSRW